MSSFRSSATLAAAALVVLTAPTSATAGTIPGQVIAGHAASYRPALAFKAGSTSATPSLLLGGRTEAVSAFAIDAGGAALDSTLNVDLLARAGLAWISDGALSPWILAAKLELDAFSGLITDAPSVAGEGLPNSGGSDTAILRKAYATLSYRGMVALSTGLTMSHWGLGLIANDGAHFWTPGSADFTDPRGGDRVLRAQLTYRSPGETWFAASVAVDSVIADDNLLEGDEAKQAIAALMAGEPGLRGGLYFVARAQEAADGATTSAYVMDLFSEAKLALSEGVDLTLAGELALIWGSTELGASAQYAEHDLLRAAGVLRATLDAGVVGGVLDLVYASGDQDLDDEVQSAFVADPNFSLGLIAFPYVMAAQTGRSTVTASDLDLMGTPPDDLERLPTRGGVSNTVALYPRLWVRPTAGLEIYGGPLFAFADVPPADPLNTRLAGGEPHNALDAASGSYLGTELDLGVRYRLIAWGSELTLGLEGAAFWPGDAIDRRGADEMGALLGGRAMLTYKL